MKKKIAIITLHDVKNYGSILQAYATQCYFEKMGLNSIIIDFRRPWETRFGYWFYVNDKSVKGIARNIMYFPSKVIQSIRFGRFKKRYLHLTRKTYSNEKELKKNPIKADIYCTGSDQVWNSGWNEGIIPEYFLNFVESNKKISYASSFGNSQVIKQEKETMKELLTDYSLITVREKQSVEMLKDEFGLKATEILDPTLQMNSEFWNKLCKPKRLVKRKYVLLIQLNRNHKFDNAAVKFAEEKKLHLVRLCLRVDQMILPGTSIVIPEVEDYIRLIRDAEYILTDSFHAVSFCLNFEKQFYVSYPSKYSERLRSILEIMGLEDREFSNNIKENEIEFSKIRKELDRKRECAKTILENYIKQI